LNGREVTPPGAPDPFYHDIPNHGKSLYWFAFNANKKGITLDIETADGQAIFKQMVKKADVVIESFTPGYMDRISLGYPELNQLYHPAFKSEIPYNAAG
jgi:crotonobetainyl-CoA:carnitine CoA-transferase CaiB-like acyl-CoA transferase